MERVTVSQVMTEIAEGTDVTVRGYLVGDLRRVWLVEPGANGIEFASCLYCGDEQLVELIEPYVQSIGGGAGIRYAVMADVAGKVVRSPDPDFRLALAVVEIVPLSRADLTPKARVSIR